MTTYFVTARIAVLLADLLPTNDCPINSSQKEEDLHCQGAPRPRHDAFSRGADLSDHHSKTEDKVQATFKAATMTLQP